MSVDCTDCSILEPYPFDRKWFSHKFKSAALRYEIGVVIETGDISWVNGPFPAGENPDISIFRKDLKLHLMNKETVVADKGYRGDVACVTDSYINSDRLLINRVRARHETINKRLKTFNILKHRFRHDKKKHSICFHAVANITQIIFENNPPFYI